MRRAPDLQGQLRSFPPPLLFQMMSLGQLDGLLTLRSGAGKCQVYFQQGRLVFARGPRQRERLGEELVRTGVLDGRSCDDALREARRSKGARRLGGILVERGLVSRADLESYIRSRIKDAIYDVVDWREGRFTFQSEVRPESEDIHLDMGLESLLLECMTRLDDARHARAEAGERRA